MPIEDFQIQQQLGKGCFGTVWKCKRKADGKVYAMKQVRIDKLKQKDRINALNEVRILASIVNSNIVEYKEAFFDEATSCLCIVMEFADGGDLDSKIKAHHKENTHFQERQVWEIAFDLLQGLKVLHNTNIIHRDLKSANVFIAGGHAKLGDLNISKILKDEMATTQTGTPIYASPQIWNDTPYGPKTDIWSLGCVIYEVCAQRPPFRAANFEGLCKKVMSGKYQRIPEKYSDYLAFFINRCLTVNEKKRASVEELLNSKMFQEMKLTTITQPINQQNQMLETIQFPKNYGELNQVLPTPNYQRKVAQLKTVVIIKDPNREPLCPLRKRLPSISKIRSQKLLPALPQSSKLLPPSDPLKPLNNLPTTKRPDSSKALRIHKAARSHKLIQLD